jgi:hypothetical protein
VNWKAEVVFLWVTLAVASILNGIADYETLPELKSRLEQLDPRLTVLLRQVLTERIQASHRKQVARSLLTECRFDMDDRVSHLWIHWNITALIQATSPQVDASHDSSLLLDDCEIDTQVLDLQRRLPGRKKSQQRRGRW